jgi:hypothetical protein
MENRDSPSQILPIAQGIYKASLAPGSINSIFPDVFDQRELLNNDQKRCLVSINYVFDSFLVFLS